jgi:hypothetical protein
MLATRNCASSTTMTAHTPKLPPRLGIDRDSYIGNRLKIALPKPAEGPARFCAG